MTDIQGTNIAAPVRPYNTECTYPTALADEIAGGLKYVETESLLTRITPERRPVGTVVSVGIGKFRQWTGSNWQAILQGLDLPTAEYSASEVRLRFGETPLPIGLATTKSAGLLSAAMFLRLMGHGKKHLQDGDDAFASLTAQAEMVPQADKSGKIAAGWLPHATAAQPGMVRLADDGDSPQDEPGSAIAVVRANDSRIAAIPNLVKQLETVASPVRYVDELPPKHLANPQVFYCLKNSGTLYLLVDGEYRPVGGSPGEPGLSAYEVAQVQGYTGSIDEWLQGLKGRDGEDGDSGKSAYQLAQEAGFGGTFSDWRASLKGSKGDDGKSAYTLATESGFVGTLAEWFISLKGTQGDDGKSAYALATESGFVGTLAGWLDSLKGTQGDDGKSAYDLATESGFTGTLADWLDSLKGDQGDKGDGIDGKSAYAIAVQEGYLGTPTEWLASLQGRKGDDGLSAYEIAVKFGFEGTETDWLASQKGKKGDKGDTGHGLEIKGYYDSIEQFEQEHPTGSPGEFYGVEGCLYVWAGDRWVNAGKLIGASAYETWLEQPGNAGQTFDRFFQELADRAFSETDLDSLLQDKITAWMTANIASVIAPLVESWLEQHLGPVLDLRLPTFLETSFGTHVSAYHQWQPM